MLDLSKTNIAADSEAGYWFELVHPATGEGVGGHIKVRGEKSRVVQQHARRVVNEMQKREKVAKGKNKELDLSFEELEDMAVERAVVRIIEWKDIGDGNGAIPFTKENATTVLKDNYWIREQVMEESDNLLNFRSE